MAETRLSGLHRPYAIKKRFVCHQLLGKSGLGQGTPNCRAADSDYSPSAGEPQDTAKHRLDERIVRRFCNEEASFVSLLEVDHRFS
jgi:hypothetical protein